MIWIGLVALGATPADARHIRLVTGDAFPPFSGLHLEDGGIITEVVRRSFEIAGYDHADIIWRSWLKGFEITVDGLVDGSFPYAYTPSRARTVLFSEPIARLTSYAWYLPEHGDLDDKRDLVGKNLCLPLGHAALGYAAELISGHLATRASPPDMETCFRLLAAGRVDSVVAPIEVAVQAIAATGLQVADFQHVGEKLSELPLHFIIGKSHPDAAVILGDFNAALATLRQSGELAEILGRAQY